MSGIPAWAAWLVSVLLLLGAGFTVVGSIGLLRLESFYKRTHAPTLGSTAGTVLIALASILYFSVQEARPALHEILIIAFITLTTPAGFILLVRAALFRDRAEGNIVGLTKKDATPRAATGGTDPGRH
jgi:multicomponent K+:H+ antiporter subunit G